MTTPHLPHLSESEEAVVREALAHRRQAGGFSPGRWSVSPLNRRAEVLGATRASSSPKSVDIRDITLRVLEQAPGVRLSPPDRTRLGDMLIESGIRRLEVTAHGWGIDADALKSTISRWRNACPDLEVKMGATQTVDMVTEAVEAGATVITHWIPAIPELTPVYWPEAYRRAWVNGDWRDGSVPTNLEESLEVYERVKERATQEGLRVAVGINLLAFATEEWLVEFLNAVAPGLPNEVWLSDGSSGLSPEAWEYVVRLVHDVAPSVPVGVYTKNAYGLGVANLVAAARAGAEILETSVNGFSMASGQPDLAQVVTALEVLYGVETGVDLARLTQLSQLVTSLTGHQPEATHPVVGNGVHNWGGAEFISQERKLDPLIHWSYAPELVGGSAGWDVTPLTGMWGISDIAERLGLVVPKARLDTLRTLILDQSAALHRALRDDEIRTLILDHALADLGATSPGPPDEESKGT